jgi:hypothetical protein
MAGLRGHRVFDPRRPLSVSTAKENTYRMTSAKEGERRFRRRRIRLPLPAEVLMELRSEAKRRDLDYEVMIIQLLTVVVADDLYAAVLDR